MSELTADVTMRYRHGPSISAALTSPAQGFFVTTLLGASGCGKTTFLRCLAGLERPAVGRIQFGAETWFDAERRIHLPPQGRGVGLLFQDYALFPHLTVSENIAYGLRRHPPSEREAITRQLLDRFQLGELAQRLPRHISGGQQQRAALARTLACRPRLLLLDEPLSALDGPLRDELRAQLRAILSEFAIPVVLVTHDRVEAMALSDQLVVMDAGRVLQAGPVEEVFSRPRDAGVARLVGVETVVTGEVVAVDDDGLARVRIGERTLTAVAPRESARKVHVCIRGEEVTLQRGPHADLSVRNQLPAVVSWISPEGPLVRIGLDCGFELTALVTRDACRQLQLAAGEQVTAAIKAPAIQLLPVGGMAR